MKYQGELRKANESLAKYEQESRDYKLKMQSMQEEVSKKMKELEGSAADRIKAVAKSLEEDPSMANEYKLMEDLADEFCRKASR